jgi:hypothetical protein
MTASSLMSGCEKKNESEKVSVSELIDWEHEKIEAVFNPRWGLPIVQNKEYVFYESYTSDNVKIMRVDKKSQEKNIILKLKRSQIAYEGGICLLKDKLFFVHDDSIYKCNLDGTKKEQIFSAQEIENQFDVDCCGIRTYKDKLYVQCGIYYIMRLDPDTETMETIADDMGYTACFYNNYLYYTCSGLMGIARVDLKNLKHEIVRGEADFEGSKWVDDKPRYENIMSVGGKLYYSYCENIDIDKPVKLYLYQENGKDKEQYNFGSDSGGSVFSSSVVGYDYDVGYDDKKNRMKLYNLKTGEKKEIELPEDYWMPEFLVDNVLFYSIPYDDREYYSVFMIH